MNIRLRFAFLFTGFVTLILAISSFSIYYLYANFRLQEFYPRINIEAEFRYNKYFDSSNNNSDFHNSQYSNLLASNKFSIVVFNKLLQPIYRYPSNTALNTSAVSKYTKSNPLKEFRFHEGDQESIITYVSKTNTYIYASAYDMYGLRKIHKIKLIILSVFFGGIAIAIFISYFFVTEALRPLKKLSNQMLKTTDIYLAKPVVVKNSKDEISQIAESYNAMIERLKEMFDFQKSFVNNASHELRTPLNLMLSETENALTKNLDTEQLKVVLQSLKEEQESVIEFTNSLLLLSKHERSAFKSWEQFRIDLFLQDSIESCKSEFPDAKVSFDFGNIRNEADLLIFANKTLLHLAIKNLIKNGYLHSFDKNVIIRLFYNDENVEITVINDGPEVPIENREKLFTPFFIAHTLDKKTHGFGIGLSIVNRIVEIHGGKILYSTYGFNKNCFIITLQKQKPVE